MRRLHNDRTCRSLSRTVPRRRDSSICPSNRIYKFGASNGPSTSDQRTATYTTVHVLEISRGQQNTNSRISLPRLYHAFVLPLCDLLSEGHRTERVNLKKDFNFTDESIRKFNRGTPHSYCLAYSSASTGKESTTYRNFLEKGTNRSKKNILLTILR